MAKAKTTPVDELKAHLARCQNDACYFVEHVIRAKPDKNQRKVLKAISRPGARVTVRSGHGVGKSTTLAWIILWFISCFTDSRVPCTAPSAPQLQDVLWAELHKWHRQMLPQFRCLIRITQDRAGIIDAWSTRFAVPRTARKEQPEALQGFHATNLLFVVDEASGVPENIFQVAEGALSTEGARVILTGNPTRSSGYFYRTHTKERADWTPLRFSSADSALVGPAYAARMAKRYGKDSNVYRIRVEGEFPTGGDDVVLPLDLLEHAKAFTKAKTFGERIAGADIARFGDDDSTLIIRHGSAVTYIDKWHGYDITESAGQIMAAWNQGLFDIVKVDTIGYGAGVADILRAQGVPVQDVQVSESPSDPQYMRLRDELWFLCRDWFSEKNVSLPVDNEHTEDLIEEACGVTYKFTSAGKFLVAPKDVMKEEIGHSPDLTDALCCTFAPETFDHVREGNLGQRPKRKRAA